MKAAVLTQTGKPLEIADNVEVRPLSQGQVLVKLAYSGVCHSQLMEVRGLRGDDPWLPHLLGHEGSGVVVETGPGVKKVKAGDSVVLGWIKGEGCEAGGAKYDWDGQVVNAGGVTTFNEMAVVSENRLTLIPEGLNAREAVLLGCAAPTGLGVVLNDLNPEPESQVVIFGLGGIGLFALMATQLCDCSKVIAVDINPAKLELAKEFGATHLINAAERDPVTAIRDLTGGGADYAIEAAGLARTIEQAFASVRKGGGRCVFASHPKHGDLIRLDPHDLISGKQIAGTWGGGCNPDRDLPRFAEAYRKHAWPLHKLIERDYRLEDVNQAIDDLEARRVTRPLLVLDKTLNL